MLAKSIRESVLERDDNFCRKCCRVEALHVHHIIPKSESGSDDLENLITLCEACHEEWHSLETRSLIPFDAWLRMPTLSIFITTFMGEWSDNVKANQMKQAIQSVHEISKQQHLLKRNLDKKRSSSTSS